MKIEMRTVALAAAAALLVASCGGGRTAVVGFGNGGNRIIEGGMLDEVADALAEYEGTPRVSDETLVQVFAGVLSRATRGEPEAALIVFRVAERQREATDD